MEELEKNETSTQAEENTVSLASAQALADALAKIEAYTPTTWVDNSSPDIDAEHLNKPELAIKRVTDALNSAVDVIKDLQSQVTKNAGDISTVNNNLSNAQKDITQLNGHKVSYYGVFNKTLAELYDLSKTNTTCYIGFIDWRQSEITIENGTIIWFACNWVVFAISGSGLYVLDGSTFKWKKI